MKPHEYEVLKNHTIEEIEHNNSVLKKLEENDVKQAVQDIKKRNNDILNRTYTLDIVSNDKKSKFNRIPFFAIEALINSCMKAERERTPDKEQKLKDLVALINKFFGTPTDDDEFGVDAYKETSYDRQKPSIHEICRDVRHKAYEEVITHFHLDLDDILDYYHATILLYYFESSIPSELRTLAKKEED